MVTALKNSRKKGQKKGREKGQKKGQNATIRSKSQIATLESPFLVLLGEEPEKVANEQLFHLFYVGLVLLEHLEKACPFLWRELCVEGIEIPPHLGKRALHVGNHLLHFFLEFVRFDSWYKVAHRRRKGSNPCMTKNDAAGDLYFGVERDTAKPEKWRNARHRTPRMGKKRKSLLENPAGHGRQPPPRRHPGGLRRLLPVVHLSARMHRHRR